MDTLKQTEQKVIVERIDDIPLLIALQQKVGLAELIDEIIPRHWLHQGLSIGQLTVGYNTYVLSQSDHRKVAVEDWAKEHQAILSDLFGCDVRRTDFTDDRLGQLLTQLSNNEQWQEVEQKLWQKSVSVYRIEPNCVRLDATRFSGYHTPDDDEGLMQHGYNRDTSNLAQIKMMAASCDCGKSGHLVATDVVSGESGEDPLYVPVIQRMQETLDSTGLLYVGDSKMSAISTRGFISHSGDFYLVPLAKVGQTRKLYDQLVRDIVLGDQPAQLVYDTPNPTQGSRLIAAGYQATREQTVTLSSGDDHRWQERILVIRSVDKADKQFAQLSSRIDDATGALLALTPEPGRGKRQIHTKQELITRAQAILEQYDVCDFLDYNYQQRRDVKTQYIGRGRGGANRKKCRKVTVRYQITGVVRNEATITEAYCLMGWNLYATNQSDEDLPVDDAVRLYRAAPRIERHFHLFKSPPIELSPMYVRNDDQIKGLTRLLSLCVRLLTLIEIVVRRNLAINNETLSGLYEGNPTRRTSQPTAVRILKAFGSINRIRRPDGNGAVYHGQPLTPLQHQILGLLEIEPSVYDFDSQRQSWFDSVRETFDSALSGIGGILSRIFKKPPT